MATEVPRPKPDLVSKRVATIDWMRGLVMVLMVIDHASMAFDGQHVAEDSALYPGASTMALPAAEFLTRWITHLCAPTFVFLAGTALALSVERRMAKVAGLMQAIHVDLATHDQSDYAGLAALTKQLREHEAETSKLEESWLQLSELLA